MSPSVLSCLWPPRLPFGSNHRPDTLVRPHSQEKHHYHYHFARLAPHDRLGEPEFDPFRGDPLPLHRTADSRPRANTAPSDSSLLIPNGGIGESPNPAHRSPLPPNRSKRSSCTTLFAFSSKRKPVPIVHPPQPQQDPPHSVSGRCVSDSDPTEVQLAKPSSLHTDDQYHYSASLTHTLTSHSPPPRQDVTKISPSKQSSLRRRNLVENPDLGSHQFSPVDSHPSHTRIQQPYAYSTSLTHSRTIDAAPPLRHATSQSFQHKGPSDINSGLAHARIPPPHFGHASTDLLQSRLKTSRSTPNLASDAATFRRSVIKDKLPRSKGQERWLSAETWWDALLSPSPRFKVKQTPRPHTATGRNVHDPVSKPVRGEPNKNPGAIFPSVPSPRLRAASFMSAASDVRPTLPALTRSRSAADLLGQPSTSVTLHVDFEPTPETLVDERTPAPMPDEVPASDAELPLPDPLLSLAQIIDEGEAFEIQRAQWKQQATKSLGNRRTRSFSRARSKSLGARHSQHTPESSKAQFNLELLAARTLLGSQSTMPTVHVPKPNTSSSHLKAYSHSYSQSVHSSTLISHSHSHAYSHSHSHSLTTSNSSKSSRNLLPRGHSRNGSPSKSTFLKAGVFCGIGQDESRHSVEEKVPSSSRADVQGAVHADAGKGSPFRNAPSSEVGIAITSTPPIIDRLDLNVPGHSSVSGPRCWEAEQESRWSSKHTHMPSEYAGPHPSVIHSNLPQLHVTSDVSLRHRLPPRAAIHPPIAPILHPYRSAAVSPEPMGNEGFGSAKLKVTAGREALEPGTERYPHISLSQADFEQYGVGEALVYASLPQLVEVTEAKPASVERESPPAAELPPHEEQFSSHESVVPRREELNSSSLAVNDPPSLANSTIHMIMSSLNPDELDEFQDLFYKPSVTNQEPSLMITQVPNDVRSSASSSPLTHLVRKLSEEVRGQQDPWGTSSDPTWPQRSESQDHPPNESGTNLVFMDLAQSSSSPPPMESSSQIHVPIQKGSGSNVQPIMVIPEDVKSSYTASVLESPLDDNENDTFGYPIRHGHFGAASAPSLIQSPVRVSTHLSILEDESDEDETAFLRPATRRYGLDLANVVRSSYLTTSDMSQMSTLSDFPLPPSARPGRESVHASILQAYFGAPSPEPESQGQREDTTGMDQEGRHADVDETLRALGMTPHPVSPENNRSTFGGSDDMDFITQLHGGP